MSLIALYNKVNSIPAVFDYFLLSVQSTNGSWCVVNVFISDLVNMACCPCSVVLLPLFLPCKRRFLSSTDGFQRLWRSFSTWLTCDSNDFVNAESHAREKPLLATTGTLFHKDILVRLHYAACLKKRRSGGKRWEATVFAVYRSNKLLLLFRNNVIVMTVKK